MLTTCAAIAIGLIVAIAARLIAGRLAGLSMTAICAATIAYFLPPMFSFRVSEPRDVAALALYGAVGLVLASPSTRRTKSLPFKEWCPTPAVPETRLESVLPVIPAGIAVEAGGALPWPSGLTARLLADLIDLALRDPAVAYISIYGARCPERQTLFVAAYRCHRQAAVAIGKCHDACQPVHLDSLPPHSRASMFDNGAGCVYQVEINRAL